MSPPQVDCFIVGTQKGGTTALARFLASHPRILVPEKKELHFFDQDEKFSHGRPDYEVLHSYFPEKKAEGDIWVDATPIYMFWAPAIERIHNYNPAAKLVVILRNPVERAYSQWIMESRRKKEWLPFYLAMRTETIRDKLGGSNLHRVRSYVSRGYYSQQLKRIFSIFPREQVMVLKTEDLRDRHHQILDAIGQFVGIQSHDWPESRSVFSNKYAAMSAASRAFLRSQFRADLSELEALLGWPATGWLD